MLPGAAEVFEHRVILHPKYTRLFEEFEQTKRHLIEYSRYWLERLDPENVFQKGAYSFHVDFLAQSLNHLVLIDDNDVSSSFSVE